MFVRVHCSFYRSTIAELKYEPRSLDASRIVLVMPGRHEGTVELWFAASDIDGPHVFVTDTYDEAGLVELVMQARLNPNAFLPSNNVGKDKAPELGSTGSSHWSAKKDSP